MDIKTLRRILINNNLCSKIKRLGEAFPSACAPFYKEIDDIEAENLVFQRKVDAGDAQWEEVTEDGYHYSHADDLSERHNDALDSLNTLRHAFIVLTYHSWERSMLRLARPNKHNHKELVKDATALGFLFDDIALENLKNLVNVIKHSSKNSGPKLYNMRRDLFALEFDPFASRPSTGKPSTTVDWTEHLVITDDNVEEAFLAVRMHLPR